LVILTFLIIAEQFIFNKKVSEKPHLELNYTYWADHARKKEVRGKTPQIPLPFFIFFNFSGGKSTSFREGMRAAEYSYDEFSVA